MIDDEDFDFRPRAGRIRDSGSRGNGRSRSFLSQAIGVAAKAKGGPPTLGEMREARRSAQTRPRKGRCSRIGRGQAAADRLKLTASMRGPAARMRRVIVKARIVRLKTGSRAADAHVRYLQRHGTTRDGERGRLYGAAIDEADGKAFVERGREDRHQFRFIVAPEEGAQLADVRAFTRDVMRQMEKDLGTQLDWVAVDHFNTGHPHSHVIVRGRDDLGKDLIIAQDYITDGMRLRAQELVTLELGPETDRELRTKLQAEVSAERFTRIDRAMLAEVREWTLDMRPEAGQVRSDFDRTLRIARLQTLERYGLAEQAEPGVWTLSGALEPTMRALGERGDIVKAINRALAGRGQARGPDTIDLHGNELDRPVVGRLIDKLLADDLGDHIGVVIDGVDGRVHHVALRGSVTADEAQIGAIVELGPARSGRPVDRNIARIARRTGGEYQPSLHRAQVKEGSVHVPGGDADAFVDAHVRRLEALRRNGIVERAGADSWLIPDDFEARTAAYDAQREPARMRLLCAADLDRQVSSDGATWLDRQLFSRSSLATSGFGAEVHQALERRADELIRQGHASRTAEGQLRVKADLIGSLARQEVERVGQLLAAERGLAFQPVHEEQTVRGKLLGSAQLVSGRFAMIDDGLGFSLVPWRPVLERNIGLQVKGVMRGGDISWQFGRVAGLGPGL